jgi:ATP diphosphatase
MTGKAPAIDSLLTVMSDLRQPETGCAWDREQDFSTIAPYTVEEAYEVAAAATEENPAQLKDELGDLLFQVVYHARLAEERGWFDFNDVATAITEKMISRHPHVFGDAADRTAAAQTAAWEVQKVAERRQRAEHGTLSGIATAIPALARAQKLTGRAARVGFDWPTPEAVLDKLAEETAELRAEFSAADPARLQDELGDMFFVLANLARKLGLSGEACLAAANAKFTRRFNAVEATLAAEGRTPQDSTLEEMDKLWNEAKQGEKK